MQLHFRGNYTKRNQDGERVCYIGKNYPVIEDGDGYYIILDENGQTLLIAKDDLEDDLYVALGKYETLIEKEHQMKVSLIAHTPEPEKVVAAAAKLCYSSCGIDDLLDGLTDDKIDSFLTHLSNLGHASPTEHASFTFAIEGVSRSLLAQITRHRIASFSVQSQRYVRMDGSDVIIPPEIENDGEAAELFRQTMGTINFSYRALCEILESKHTEELMIEGMSEKAARIKASKMANEDARFVLPNASTTKMIVTMNARELNAFFNLRCCNRAQWEIRSLAEEMLKLVYPIAPHLFANAGPACVHGNCSEGAMCCGKANEVRCKYSQMMNSEGKDENV